MFPIRSRIGRVPLCAASRGLKTLLSAATILAAQVTAAYAQSTTAAPAAGGDKSYGVPWLIIVVVAALGLFITLRPAGRSGEIKRDARADL